MFHMPKSFRVEAEFESNRDPDELFTSLVTPETYNRIHSDYSLNFQNSISDGALCQLQATILGQVLKYELIVRELDRRKRYFTFEGTDDRIPVGVVGRMEVLLEDTQSIGRFSLGLSVRGIALPAYSIIYRTAYEVMPELVTGIARNCLAD